MRVTKESNPGLHARLMKIWRGKKGSKPRNNIMGPKGINFRVLTPSIGVSQDQDVVIFVGQDGIDGKYGSSSAKGIAGAD
jgi:hypothetical protein